MSSSLHCSPVADNLLPKGRMDRMMLVDAIYSEDSLYWPRELPAVERLRRNWVHQYHVIEGQLRLHKEEDMPLHHSAVNPLGSVENCLSKPVDNGIVC